MRNAIDHFSVGAETLAQGVAFLEAALASKCRTAAAIR